MSLNILFSFSCHCSKALQGNVLAIFKLGDFRESISFGERVIFLGFGHGNAGEGHLVLWGTLGSQ